MIINVNNNGVKIGTVNINSYNVKKFCLAAATIGVSVLTLAGCSKAQDKKVASAPVAQVSEMGIPYYNPLGGTYSVKYDVNYGDSLYGLVTSYCEDANKVNYIIDEIVRENELSSAGSIRQGSTIKLVGVPEEHLDDFGYIIPDEEDLTAEQRLVDSVDYISSYVYNGRNAWKITSIKRKVTDSNKEFIEETEQEMKDFLNSYRYYKTIEDDEEKDSALSELVWMADCIKTDIKLVTGDVYTTPAHPSTDVVVNIRSY